MKTRRVKIHDRKWFDENCEIDHHGDYYKDGDWFICSENNCIIGKTITQVQSTCGNYFTEGYTFPIPEWAIEREITETDDLLSKFIEYVKDTPKPQLIEEWNKCEAFGKIGPTVEELMNDLKNIQHEI